MNNALKLIVVTAGAVMGGWIGSEVSGAGGLVVGGVVGAGIGALFALMVSSNR